MTWASADDQLRQPRRRAPDRARSQSRHGADQTATLAPAGESFARAETHWVRIDGEKIHFGHITRGVEREWFVRGGTFRFNYLPLSGRLLT